MYLSSKKEKGEFRYDKVTTSCSIAEFGADEIARVSDLVMHRYDVCIAGSSHFPEHRQRDVAVDGKAHNHRPQQIGVDVHAQQPRAAEGHQDHLQQEGGHGQEHFAQGVAGVELNEAADEDVLELQAQRDVAEHARHHTPSMDI